MHSKAELRAVRESLGLTQQRMADLLGVKVLSVKRWELPRYPQQAPDDAWELLDDHMRRQDVAVQAALSQMDRIAMNMGGYPDEVALPYWSSAEDYKMHHYLDDGGAESWVEVNATNRRIAFALRERDIAVRWVDGSENVVPKPQVNDSL